MDALLLSRIQFGLTVGIHYLFPITTLGLTLYILIFETLVWRKNDPVARAASSFLIRLLALIFTAGVATGLMLPFAFGANWARFSDFAGAVFGSALAIEAVTAFALESAFLAILLFGRNKVSPFVYWLSAFMVFFGSHLSAFWIVCANSWMQAPAGFEIQNGKIVLESAFAALFNPTAAFRVLHVIVGNWISGSFVVAGLGAWYAVRNRFGDVSAMFLKTALPLLFVFAALQPVIGHFHIQDVIRYNPEKDAAYEGIFYATEGAPLLLFGIPDEKNRTVRFSIGIPYLLSIMTDGNPHSRVPGLTDYPEENWPPVAVVFTTFHLMIMLGVLMIGIGALGLYLKWKRHETLYPKFLRVLPWLIPIPYLADELGWISAEIGRQPWIIYKVMRTSEAFSVQVPAWQIAVSLTVMVAIYVLLALGAFYYIRCLLAEGPAHAEVK